MARLAIFVDGGYLDILANNEFKVRVNHNKLSEAIVDVIRSATPEPLDLFRTFYYTCLPFQSDPPTPDESSRYSKARVFVETLIRLPRYEVRLGRLAYRGIDSRGQAIFQQKGVDIQLGLDFALLSSKQTITHAAILSGDSDLVPAVNVAKQEGVSVWLAHGPRGTYANELWNAADDRFELSQEFMSRIARR